MIADINTTEAAELVTEAKAPIVVVQDIDLMYVGGGTGTGMLF